MENQERKKKVPLRNQENPEIQTLKSLGSYDP